MNAVFRDPNVGWQQQLKALLAARQAELDALDPRFERLYAARVARLAAGATAFMTMNVVFLLALFSMFGMRGYFTADLVGDGALAAWLTTAAVYLLARPLAARTFRPQLERSLHLSGDLPRDVDSLMHATVPQRAASLVATLDRGSAVWPLVGMAMAFPLVLHWLLYAIHLGQMPPAASVGMWIGRSAVTVWHSHSVLASGSWRFASRLARDPELSESTEPASGSPSGGPGARAVGITVMSSFLPGMALFAVPCILVGLTALIFVPGTFAWAQRTARHERRLLASLAG